MGYSGPERRVHRVFVTRNTEYHVRGAICVAVREIEKGPEWSQSHPAVGRVLEGALRYQTNGVLPIVDEPEIGDAIYFRQGEHDLVTSRVQRIERPARKIVSQYPRRAKA